MIVSLITFVRRSFKQTTKSLYRGKWFNLMTILALTLVFLLVHTTSALTSSAEQMIRNLQKKVDIGVFFLDTAEEYQIDLFLAELKDKKEKGEIKDFSYFSRDDELKDFEERYPERMVFIRRHNLSNPLLAMVEIVPVTGKTDELVAFLTRDEFADIVDQQLLRDSESERTRVRNFLAIASFAENSGGTIFVFFLVIATGLLFYAISNAAKAHEKEIAIMRLVGAKFWHIRLPYIFESVIIALIAFIFSLILAFSIFFVFSLSVENIFPEAALREDIAVFLQKLMSVLSYNVFKNAVLILALAIIGGFLGIERLLRQQKIL